MVALAAAAPPAPSAVYDNTGSFELNDETRGAYNLGYLRGKNIDIEEQLLGEGDLSHRGLVKRSNIGDTTGHSNPVNGHRVKRAGKYGAIGLKYKSICLIPPAGTALCPVVKTIGKKLTKVGASLVKTAPVAPVIVVPLGLKQVLTKWPISPKFFKKYG